MYHKTVEFRFGVNRFSFAIVLSLLSFSFSFSLIEKHWTVMMLLLMMITRAECKSIQTVRFDQGPHRFRVHHILN